MSRIYLTIIALLLAALGLIGWAAKTQYDTVSDLRIENAALTEASERAAERSKADRQLLVARQAENASQARKSAQSKQALSEALQRDKSWSDTNVPADVQSALAARSDGLAGVLPAPQKD